MPDLISYNTKPYSDYNSKNTDIKLSSREAVVSRKKATERRERQGGSRTRMGISDSARHWAPICRVPGNPAANDADTRRQPSGVRRQPTDITTSTKSKTNKQIINKQHRFFLCLWVGGKVALWNPRKAEKRIPPPLRD